MKSYGECVKGMTKEQVRTFHQSIDYIPYLEEQVSRLTHSVARAKRQLASLRQRAKRM